MEARRPARPIVRLLARLLVPVMEEVDRQRDMSSAQQRVPAGRTKFKFRHDPEIQQFLDGAYCHQTIDQCVAAANRRFGDRAPSRSAIGRYFKWLDENRGARA
jgi:hypothetical protein